MTKGKAACPVYVYLVPKDKWPDPKDIFTAREESKGIYIDMHKKTSKVLGYEFLDCYGVEINGMAAK